MMYLVLKMSKFSDIELIGVNHSLPAKLLTSQVEDRMVGFLPLFDDLDKALEWAGSPELIQLVDFKEKTACRQ